MPAAMQGRGGWAANGWRRRVATRSSVTSRVSDERGMVTAELAAGLPALVVVATALAWLLGLVASQVMLGQAAREGARVAARGEDRVMVARAVHHVVGDAQVGVRRSGDHVIVSVWVRREPGPRVLRPLGRDLRASATAWWEQP